VTTKFRVGATTDARTPTDVYYKAKLAYIDKRRRYFCSEVTYCSHLLGLATSRARFEGSRSREFRDSAREYASRLSEILNAVCRRTDECDALLRKWENAKAGGDGAGASEHLGSIREKFIIMERLLGWLAVGVHQYQIYIGQFSRRSVRNYLPLSFPHIVSQDSHPSYGNEIGIIYKYMFELTDVFERMLSPLNVSPPLITLTDKKDYTFDPDSSDNEIIMFMFDEPTKVDILSDREQFNQFVKKKFTSTHIGIPRYSPSELRHLPILVHEMMHMIYRLVRIDLCNVVEWQLARDNNGKDVTQKQIDSIINGTEDCAMKELRIAINDSFKYFEHESGSFFGRKTSKFRRIFGRGLMDEQIRTSFAKQIEETIADYAGVHIAGPAYYYCLMESCLDDISFDDVVGSREGLETMIDEDSDAIRILKHAHPPVALRLAIVGKELDSLGYGTEYLDFIEEHVQPRKHRNKCFRKYYETLVEEDPFRTIRKFFKNHVKPLSVNLNNYKETCEEIAKEVLLNNYMLDFADLPGEIGDPNCTWIINAIWYKSLKMSTDRQPYEIWRLAMEHSKVEGTKNGDSAREKKNCRNNAP